MVTSIIGHGYVTGKPNVGILMKTPQEAQQYGVPAACAAVPDGSPGKLARLAQAGCGYYHRCHRTAVSGSEALKAAVQTWGKAGDKALSASSGWGHSGSLRSPWMRITRPPRRKQEQLQKDYREQQAQWHGSSPSRMALFPGLPPHSKTLQNS